MRRNWHTKRRRMKWLLRVMPVGRAIAAMSYRHSPPPSTRAETGTAVRLDDFEISDGLKMAGDGGH